MIQVGVLLTKQYKLLSVAAILDVFETANKFHADKALPAPYKLNLLNCGEHKDIFFDDYESKSINEATTYDLILIPAFTTADIKDAIAQNAGYIPWLHKQYQQDAEIATVCTGAFLLGATGLLDGKAATTHVDASKAFAKAFPAVNLKADKTSNSRWETVHERWCNLIFSSFVAPASEPLRQGNSH